MNSKDYIVFAYCEINKASILEGGYFFRFEDSEYYTAHLVCYKILKKNPKSVWIYDPHTKSKNRRRLVYTNSYRSFAKATINEAKKSYIIRKQMASEYSYYRYKKQVERYQKFSVLWAEELGITIHDSPDGD